MRDYFKTGITLMIITVIAAFALSAVYSIVKEPIANAELGARLQAIRDVLKDPSTGKSMVSDEKIPSTASDLANFEWSPSGFQVEDGIIFKGEDGRGKVDSPVYRFTSDDGMEIYIAIASAVGYGGDVKTMASFISSDTGLKLNGIKVLEYSQETPGLGANIASSDIQKRFYPVESSGLERALKVNKDAGVTPTGEEIDLKRETEGIVTVTDVMTGATITPRAVTVSINTMYQFLKKAGVK
ncbi:MAG TPA: RnfABCDGE type electron transport complex subunit G [Mesotoga infera]|jgi:electron transport complex protein RnfG|nr:RnfABCDGE type electron transport complex subunit G [Thermotogaceae bacterium]HNR79298.1 RnfABCDGE type electron transport complex subunit G [Mesotoga infera]HRR43252.1 RnfABCDGE type electron transport complex subunit G [Mesotoga sp.]HNS66338.1 RnfABCDGE type electron transport complex subunit G [Mesotoga infera]HOI33649.1 RnfABCDGE type electron transport complex subunit G [Mesotoga infera]